MTLNSLFPTGGARRAAKVSARMFAGLLSLVAVASCVDKEDIANYPCPIVSSVREFWDPTKFQGESLSIVSHAVRSEG